MTHHLHIVYTSDVHGRLLAHDYGTGTNDVAGLTRLTTWLKSFDQASLLLDNGDLLQGSPLLDHHRLRMPGTLNPAALAVNHLGYDAITLGNHDFNYGRDYLDDFTKTITCPVICCNILDEKGHHVYRPYLIHKHDNGIKTGIIGAITGYVPQWEQPGHIKGLVFEDAYDCVKTMVGRIRADVDVIVVLYHGGIEKDFETGQPLGVQSHENQGHAIAGIAGIDVLLTGHQHLPLVVHVQAGPLVLQTADQARMAGVIKLVMDNHDSGWRIKAKTGQLVNMDMPEDPHLSTLLKPYHDKTLAWLSEPIGQTRLDMRIDDPFQARLHKHPLFEWINHLQLRLSGAMISCSSLPNQAPGFAGDLTLNDLAANFVFPNILVKLRIDGKTLKAGLERSAMYFALSEGVIVTDPSFLHPKIEHYNVDIYDGIDYTIDVSRPVGSRITRLLYQGQPVKDDDHFTIVMNNYRATGGGHYPMFAKAEVLATYQTSLIDLAKAALAHEPVIDFKPTDNLIVTDGQDST